MGISSGSKSKKTVDGIIYHCAKFGAFFTKRTIPPKKLAAALMVSAIVMFRPMLISVVIYDQKPMFAKIGRFVNVVLKTPPPFSKHPRHTSPSSTGIGLNHTQLGLRVCIEANGGWEFWKQSSGSV